MMVTSFRDAYWSQHTLGAVTHTKVNAISHGNLFLGDLHLGFSKPS